MDRHAVARAPDGDRIGTSVACVERIVTGRACSGSALTRAHCLGLVGGRVKILASSVDIARACHARPTLAEALEEAALAVDGRANHS